MIFQEKHTTGRLWWRKTYYTYWRELEGRMLQMPLYPTQTIEAMEKK